ncbi:hypothetical protein SS50377_20922 [Spironucleus salmonicida]|uniref:Uncharacterized protein n=1 Tax=Spironucleus salmonicida TaxID=348837 RepID=V6LGA9_9EUKA|nr:hypothetical protein SS50377_20922 [Spironucleus salmonicida]|eukprot:EST43595.1 Hypothetical protein SS50377_16637 [Spironucleus salmonicida]
MYSQIISRLRQLDRQTQQIYGDYTILPLEERNQAVLEMNCIKDEVSQIQQQVVAAIDQDYQSSPEDENEITQLIIQINQRFNMFNTLSQPSHIAPTSPIKANSMIPPHISVTSTTELNDNVKELREQLKIIHSMIIQAESANQISQQELEESKQIKDISTLAVTQLKNTTVIQNQYLQTELASIRQQLVDALEENNALKASLAELSMTNTQLNSECLIGKQNTDTLYEERKRTTEDFERIKGDMDRCKNKFDNLKQLYDFEVASYSTFREDAYRKIATLEAEKEALQCNNERLVERCDEIERCDMDSAAIEVKRAAVTIKHLTDNIVSLQDRLQENRSMTVDNADKLKATIAVISDGTISGALESDQIEKSQLMKELNDSRSELQQYKSMLSSVTKNSGHTTNNNQFQGINLLTPSQVKQAEDLSMSASKK